MADFLLKKTKKIPMRKCVVSNQILPKRELIRIVKTKDGQVFVDHTNKANGKGVYLQPKVAFVEVAKKNKVLEKALAIKFNDEIYQQIIFEIKNHWD